MLSLTSANARKIRFSIPLVLLMATVVAACQPSEIEVPVTVEVEVLDEVVVTQVVVEETIVEVPAEGPSTLVVGVAFEPGNLGFSFEPLAWTIHRNVNSFLTTHEVDSELGTYLYEEVICDICEDIEVAPDGSKVTYKIRPGVTFSNGSELTAEDIRWSYERDFSNPFGEPMHHVAGIGTVEDYKVIDDYTLEMHFPDGMTRFSQSAYALPVDFTIYDKETLLAQATADDPWASDFASRFPIGSGPYVVKEWSPGQQIVLEAREDYYGDPQPEFERIIYRFIPDEQTRAILLQSGEIDVAFDLSAAKLAELSGDPGIEIFSAPAAQDILAWRMNPDTPPFDDIHFRKAIMHALPYQTIIDETTFGYATGNPDVCGTTTLGYEAQPQFAYDLELARSELAQSKYPDGASFAVTVQSDRQDRIDALVWVQAELAKLDIDMEIETLPTAAYFDTAISRELPNDANIHTMGPWLNDCMYWMLWMIESDSATNHVGLNYPRVDELIQGSFSELDQASYLEIVDEARSILTDDVTVLPLYLPNFSVAHREGLDGFVYWPWFGVEWKYVTAEGE